MATGRNVAGLKCSETGIINYYFERGKKKHHAEKKQQMVITSKHMADPQADVPDVAARQHAQTVGLRNAMCQSQQGKTAGK